MIAMQYHDDGILAVAVHPGAVNTEMAQESKGAEVFFKCEQCNIDVSTGTW